MNFQFCIIFSTYPKNIVLLLKQGGTDLQLMAGPIRPDLLSKVLRWPPLATLLSYKES